MNKTTKPMTHPRCWGSSSKIGMLALFATMLFVASAFAQDDYPLLRFQRPAPIRLTVSVNTTNTGTITNLVNLSSNVVSPVTLSISNLPAGCGYDLVTTNGSQGTTLVITNDTPLSITINSTNVPQGEYTFYLMAVGGGTNRMPFVLQSCYIWNGAGTNLVFNTNNFGVPTFNWTNTASWVGGNAPGTNSGNDVFFGTLGAVTNRDASGLPFTNVNISQNITVGSLRFGPGTYADTNGTASTNALTYHMLIAGSTTLAVTNSKGFNLLRDYIAEYANPAGSGPDRRTALFISGSATGARLLISNVNANFAMLWDTGGVNAGGENVLNMTNLSTFEANVNRVGFGDYQLYPNYRDMNVDTNGLGGVPRKFMANVILARTNLITANYKSPDNYANDLTRQYGIMWLDSETSGNGSGEANALHFGFTNVIKSDAVCFVGGNMASGNAGAARFRGGQNNNGAVFRSTGGGRMSLFTISDGGGTNDAGSNMKANIDFWGGQTGNMIDIQTTNFFIARDRSSIDNSNTVNYTGDFLMGKGTNDTFTAILGYQEHEVRLNPNLQQPAGTQLGYCRGSVTVTNGGVFKIAGQLTLGYTADTNDVTAAEIFNTWGRVTLAGGGSMLVSNVVVDGGPRNYSHLEGHARGDSISLNLGALTLTTTIGNAPGQPLHSFTTERSTNIWNIAVGRTNLICRNLSTPGTAASVIKVASLTGVTSYPTTIPIISYETPATPFLQADMSSVPGVFGYMLNNSSGSSVDLYLTTNAPRQLLWKGNVSGNWDTNTLNWVPVGGGAPTKFTIGDIAFFDDTAIETNIVIVDTVVPGQTGAGVVVSNNTKAFFFSGGTIAGTSLMQKTGTNVMVISATKQGPVTVLQGSMEVGASGLVGTTTVGTNVFVNCLGQINGGLTCTGSVVIANGATMNGPLNLVFGWIENDGTIASFPGAVTWNDGNITNRGVMNITGGAWTIPATSTLVNFKDINNNQLGDGRLNINGRLVSPGGRVLDPDGGLTATYNGRLTVINPVGLLSLGDTITNMTVGTRFDLNAANNTGWGTVIVKVDRTHPQLNDQYKIDLWNNLQGKIVMTNVNPASPYADGDQFQVFLNTAGPATPMYPDTPGDYPTIVPTIPGAGLQWDLKDFRNYGIIKVKANAMVWRGNVNSIWDTGLTANWLGGTFTNSGGAVFDESAGAGSRTVILTNPVSPAGYILTTNSITTNIVSGVTNILIDQTSNSVAWVPGIIVSNVGTYTFSNAPGVYSNGFGGSIDGWAGLYKTGPGILDLGISTNRFTGAVIIDQGTVVIGSITEPGPLGSPSLTSRAPNGSEKLLLSGGAKLSYTGTTTNSGRGITLGLNGGGVLEISNAAANLVSSGTFRDGPLTKIGPGTLTLAGSSLFTNVTVSDGMLRVGNNTGAGVGHIIMSGGSLGFTNNPAITNLINLTVATAVANTNVTVLGGSWVGSGDATITNLAPSILSWNRDLTNYTGNITFVGNGTNRFNSGTNNFNAKGSATTVFDLGASARLESLTGGSTNNAPITYDLGGLAGGAGSSLAGRATNDLLTASNSIYSIGAKGVDTVFAGTIIDGVNTGTVAVVKVGVGRLALNGINTYSGGTTVSNGTLGGSGSVASALAVAASGTIAPGNSVGTFTVSNNATLGGTTLMELNGSTSDQLRVTGTLTGGGVLTVTNIGPTLTNGTVFALFNQAVTGFTVTNLPAPYQWTVNLGGNGTITVLTNGIVPPSINPNPTNITFSVAGNTLTLSWPADHLGWVLQTQTNATSVGLTLATNTWFNVPGSAATTSTNMAIDSTKPTVFYRLVLP